MTRLIAAILCFTLAALIPMTAYGASSERGAITVDGKRYGTRLHLPEAAGPVPLVVMIPGTSGVDRRQRFSRSHLLSAGIGTFVVDIKTGIFDPPINEGGILNEPYKNSLMSHSSLGASVSFSFLG